MKKVLAIILVALFAVCLVACGDSESETKTPAAETTAAPAADNATPATDDDVIVDYVTGADKDNTYGEYGFWGPYYEGAMVELSTTDGLIFDTSVTDSYFTTEVAPAEMPSKQYAVLEIKTDDVAGIEGFTAKFGGVGLLWKDWKGVDGNSVPALTTDYQTIVIDLYASGVDDPNNNITAANNGADIAMNKGEAAQGKIYVKTIKFTNTAPAA